MTRALTFGLLAAAALTVGAAPSATAAPAAAEDRELVFIHALQNKGYADVAVDYLDALAKRPDEPEAVKKVWDLEMANSLQAQAETMDPSQSGPLLDKAKEYLKRYVESHPDDPAALHAQVDSAEKSVRHARQLLAEAAEMKDGPDKTARMGEVRKAFNDSRAPLKMVADKVAKQLANFLMPANGSQKTPALKRRAELQLDSTQIRGDLALMDYNVAQTYPNGSGEKKELLESAAKQLDVIYQEHRADDQNTDFGRLAIIAHAWYGRAVEEIGDAELAKDVYEEVLAFLPDPPDPKDQPNGLEDVLARTKHYRLLMLAADPKKERQYCGDAADFLKKYKKNFSDTWGYQAISMTLVEHLLEDAKKETRLDEKRQMLADAKALLLEMEKVPSEFQSKAFREERALRTGGKGPAGDPKSVAEALDMAEQALQAKDYKGAAEIYEKALKLAKDPLEKAKIEDAMLQCEIQPMYDEFNDAIAAEKEGKKIPLEKYKGWLKTARRIATEHKKLDIAPKVASFGVSCAWTLFRLPAEAIEKMLKAGQTRTDADKETLKRLTAQRDAAAKDLQEMVDFVIHTFPGTAEADEARMWLGRSKAIEGNIAEAIAIFEAISPQSDKHAEAVNQAGQLRYTRYYDERRKPEAQQNKKQIEEDRAAAIKLLSETIAATKSGLHRGDPIPSTLIVGELQLAELYLSVKNNKGAIDTLQPLVNAINAAHPDQLDKNMVEIYRTLVKTYLALNDFPKAAAVGNALIDMGPDTLEINSALIGFIVKLDAERQDLEIKLSRLGDNAPPQQSADLRNQLQSVQDMLGKMLVKMAARKQLSIQHMIFIGNLFYDIGDISSLDSAKVEYNAVLEKGPKDDAFMQSKDRHGKSNAEALLIAVQAKLIGVLRKQGNLKDALAEAVKLQAAKPHALEPMISLAEIAQAQAEKSSDPKEYNLAIEKWATIRKSLDKMKPRRPEYYDAVYNTANCLLGQAKKEALTDRAAAIKTATTGARVLNSELIGNPHLNGPQSVERYKALRDKLTAFH